MGTVMYRDGRGSGQPFVGMDGDGNDLETSRGIGVGMGIRFLGMGITTRICPRAAL